MQNSYEQPSNKGAQLYERWQREKELAEEQRQKIFEKRQEEEEKELKFSPQLPKHAKNHRLGKSLFEYNRMWKSDVEQRLESERQKAEQQKELESKPQTKFVSKQSEKILKRMNYEGPISAWDRHFEEFEKKKQGQAVDRREFTPKISDTSALAHRDEVVFTRLYRDSEEREMIHRENLNEEFTFHPQTKSYLDESERREDVYEDLYRKAEEIKHKREQEVEAQLRSNNHTPKINSFSNLIASKVVREPLYKARSSSKQESEKTTSTSSSSTADAHSQLSKTSASFTSSRNDEAFLRKYANQVNAYFQKKEKNEQEHERELLRECSFSPQLDHRSLRAARKEGHKSADSSDVIRSKVSIYERTAEAKSRREKELEALRKQQAMEEVKECTFSPFNRKLTARPQTAPTSTVPKTGYAARAAYTKRSPSNGTSTNSSTRRTGTNSTTPTGSNGRSASNSFSSSSLMTPRSGRGSANRQQPISIRQEDRENTQLIDEYLSGPTLQSLASSEFGSRGDDEEEEEPEEEQPPPNQLEPEQEQFTYSDLHRHTRLNNNRFVDSFQQQRQQQQRGYEEEDVDADDVDDLERDVMKMLQDWKNDS